MLTIVLIAVGVTIAGVLMLAAMKPDTFRVERTATIAAPPEKIYPLLADFHVWPAWSPWEKKDPGMQRTYSGAASGTGAAYAWQGNRDAGKGRMEITDARLPTRLTIKLDFVKPFETHNTVDFTLRPEAGSTRVTWAMQGPAPFVSKVMQVFMNLDRVIGRDFEAGLQNLKSAAENKRE
jgi:uncharacterized protein YndB with AHSA1/START domain